MENVCICILYTLKLWAFPGPDRALLCILLDTWLYQKKTFFFFAFQALTVLCCVSLLDTLTMQESLNHTTYRKSNHQNFFSSLAILQATSK